MRKVMKENIKDKTIPPYKCKVCGEEIIKSQFVKSLTLEY